jgi:hypothetical protein
MKKELPVLLGLIVGFFALIEFYVPHFVVGTIKDHLVDWTLVLSAGAYIVGGINILQVNIPKVRRRDTDWPYKVVLLFGAATMMLTGIAWHTFGKDPRTDLEVVSREPFGAPDGMGQLLIVTSEGDALVKIGNAPDQPAARADHRLVTVDVAPGTTSVRLHMNVSGYTEVTGDVELKEGEVVTVRGAPKMMWGPEGRVFVWIYDHVFAPCNSTMFALLAFFVASAAFRAFRARNAEAALLLISAIIILIGRAPMGRAIHPWLPELADWMLDIPNNAGRRAIMMGAAIGAIATGLRVILGLERSHLGSD